MLVVLALTGLGLLALPGLLAQPGSRLHPAEWARLCLVAVGGGAVVLEAAVLLYALPTLATSSGIGVLAQLCRRMLGPLAPGGPVAGWTATAAAATVPVLAAIGRARTRRRTRTARVESWLGHHDSYHGNELVVLPTDHLVAVSVPATPALTAPDQIVVSDGLLATLTPDQLDAVLHHEAAHLRHRHHRHLEIAAVIDHAFAWFRPARRSTATLRLALERWADEEAASTTGDRSIVRQALMAVTASLVADPSLAAFSAAETISQRLDALAAESPHPRLASHLLLYGPGALLGTVALMAVWSWTSGASTVLEMAGQCVS